MYNIENGLVYDNHTTENGSNAQVCIGNEIQYILNETDSQKIYQWQKFNIETGVYENDIANTTLIEGQAPVNGQVIITKIPTPTTDDKLNFIYYKLMGVI